MNINEANSALQGKGYPIPMQVMQSLQARAGEGNERVTALLNHPVQTYEQLKKLKHDVESGVLQGDWSGVIVWVNSILARDRNVEHNRKQTTMEIGMENRFRATHDKDYNANITPLSVNENIVKRIKITEAQSELIKKELISEGEDFSKYKVHALRNLLKEKMEQLSCLKSDIRDINALLNKKASSDIDLSERKK